MVTAVDYVSLGAIILAKIHSEEVNLHDSCMSAKELLNKIEKPQNGAICIFLRICQSRISGIDFIQ